MIPSSSAPCTGGGGEQFARRQFQAGRPIAPRSVQAGPHQHVQPGRLQGAAQIHHPGRRRRPAAAGYGPAGRSQTPGDGYRGQAVQGHRRHDHHEGGRQDLGRAADSLATRAAENVEAVAAATMPRGAIQPTKARSPRFRSVRRGAEPRPAAWPRTTRTATRPSVGRTTCRSDCGVTVAEMEMNSRPMMSWTRVSKNGRRAGGRSRQVGQRQPHDDRGDQARCRRGPRRRPAATADRGGELRAGAEHLARAGSLRSSSHSRTGPAAPPTSPIATLTANCASWLPGPCGRSARTAWNTSAPRMPPTGSISDPSQIRTRCSRSSAGRNRATARRPSVQRPPGWRRASPPRARHAEQRRHRAARTQVISAPRDQPDHYPPGVALQLAQVQAEAGVIEDHRDRQRHHGWNAAPSRCLGLTSLVSAPAMNPTGSRRMSAGMRNRLASNWEPTARTTISPKPSRI